MWTQEELTADAAEAKAMLVGRRNSEQLAKRALIHKREPHYREALRELLDATGDLRYLPSTPDVLEKREVLDAARYIGLPFVSLGDIDTITGSCFEAWVGQSSDTGRRPTEDEFAAAAEYLYREIDPYRAPWIEGGRTPTDEERERFLRATIALRLNSVLQTQRRNAGSKRQEAAVRTALTQAGYGPAKTAKNIVDPVAEMPPRSFGPNARDLRSTSIDVPIRLPDDHPTGLLFIALEAKDTNTEINSRKRLIEVMSKAATWNASGLPYQIRTAAVLSGSFSVPRLEEAQSQGVMLFWEHRLSDLVGFLAV